MAVHTEPFGSARDGRPVEKITLRRGGMEAEVITYGAALRALRVPDRTGKPLDVVLGYKAVSAYEDNGGYVGAVVGRYANRIAGASCAIDGRMVSLVPNEGGKQLHGGPHGFSKQIFTIAEQAEDSVTLACTAPDGLDGWPGELALQVAYYLTDCGLGIQYKAVSSKPTYCNITNHAYFNLDGGGDAMGQTLWVDADRFTPVGPDSIPLAMGQGVLGTPLDFTAEKPIARDIGADWEQLRNVGGYDHSFLLNPAQGLRLAARLTGAASGISMEVWTEKPAVQFYSGNFLNGPGGKGGVDYGPRMGVCLETQFIPDSPNHPEWGDVVLRPGRRYDYTTEFRFSVRQG